MRLFHVSEESDIRVFHPRVPPVAPAGPPVVWAIDESCLANYLTPRDCPRVTYHAGPETCKKDIDRFFSSRCHPHVVAIENGWFQRLLSTKLICYAFDPSEFALADGIAGYYTSEKPQIPMDQVVIENLPEALFVRNVELRVLPSLWQLHDAVIGSTLRYSIIRMRNAQDRR